MKPPGNGTTEPVTTDSPAEDLVVADGVAIDEARHTTSRGPTRGLQSVDSGTGSGPAEDAERKVGLGIPRCGSDFLLVDCGFHWINEYPFNR